MSDPIENPFRDKEADDIDLSDPTSRLDFVRKVGKEMNECLASLATGKSEPMDVIIEALSAAFAVLEIAEADALAQTEGAGV